MADELNLAGLTKLVTVLTALAYATGVVAINTYLHELGIADFSFAKPKLLLTGILALFSLLLLSSHLFFLAWSLATRHSHTDRDLPQLHWVIAWAAFFLLLLAGSSALLCFRQDSDLGLITVRQAKETLANQAHLFRLRATLRVAVEVYLPILIAAVFVYVATRIYDKAKLKGDRLEVSLEQFYFLICLCVIAMSVIGYVYMFTRTFYPAIPQEFGGGEPYYESLAIDDGERCKLLEIGVPFEENEPAVTKPLPVLHETDALLAVWLRCPPKQNCGDGNPNQEKPRYIVVQIDKSAIRSMRAYTHYHTEPLIAPAAANCQPPGTPAPASP